MQQIQQTLNKSVFKKQINLCALIVPVKKIAEVRTTLTDIVYKQTNFKSIQNHDTDKQKKLIFLNETYKLDTVKTQLEQNQKEVIEKNEIEIVQKSIELGYDNLSYNEILNILIPEEIGIPTGFEQVGQIAHFNLKPEQIPFQHLIGQVLMDKIGKIKTVVNKTEKLHNVYRTPTLELMAGKKDYIALVNEGKMNFKLDFEKVYWCSRNGHERDRTLTLLKPTDTVFDMFCGVGPLSLRAAKMGCNVIANDLNPYCYEYLVKNTDSHNLNDKVLCLCEDARVAMHNFLNIKYLTEKKIDKKFWHFSQIYMNLPVDNIEFLDCIRGLLVMGDSSIWNEKNLPTIHLYCFVKGNTDEQCKQLITERIQKQLPNFQSDDIQHMVNNKDVNKNVRMYCITFDLRKEDALLEPIKLENKKIEQEEQQDKQLEDQKQNNDKAEDYEKIEKKQKTE